MPRLGMETHIVDQGTYTNTVRRFREAGIGLPTFAELVEPAGIPGSVRAALENVNADEPHPLNLFRVHWNNRREGGGFAAVPEHVVLPESLTGVEAPIVVLFGNRFPMIRAHKVLAAFGCLVPRIVTGQFDPTRHRAVWPSTGNYCRGGVAISRIMGCHGVAVLPEGMSRERFEWLDRWVSDPNDIVRTPGTESNVKEIYDKCAELEKDPDNIIFNQFSEFGNYLVHYFATGRAILGVFDQLRAASPQLRLAAFTSATGSAGTLAAGDRLKREHGTKIVAAEALECPTLLENGFGEHNIQGIGDKHVPLIHNVMNTDLVTAVSDRATDQVGVLFNTPAGRDYLAKRRGVPREIVDQLGDLGLSSICNVLSAIKTARYYGFGPADLVFTVATDGAAMYETERDKTLARRFPAGFDAVSAGETFGRHVLGASTDNLLELSVRDRNRIFNLGYYTWVEQQGLSIDEFESRRGLEFWDGLLELLPRWDAMIAEFNGRTGLARPA